MTLCFRCNLKERNVIMIEYYTQNGKSLEKTESIAPGVWVYAIAPNADEVNFLAKELNIETGFITSALDEEERSHIDTDEDSGSTLIVVDAPIALKDEKNVVTYSTVPIGMIFTKSNLLTVCLRSDTVLSDFTNGFVKNINPSFKTRMFLQIMMHMAQRYMQYLRQIDKITDYIEKRLNKSTSTNELVQMLDLQKSLVYFTTALKNAEMNLSRIERGKVLKLYSEDDEILEDVIIEYKQAREMADIFSSVLSGTIDTFSTVISNNLNETMKKLTSVTILIAIPTMIAGFYGMNINMDGLPLSQSFWLIMGLCVVITGAAVAILIKKKML